MIKVCRPKKATRKTLKIREISRFSCKRAIFSQFSGVSGRVHPIRAAITTTIGDGRRLLQFLSEISCHGRFGLIFCPFSQELAAPGNLPSGRQSSKLVNRPAIAFPRRQAAPLRELSTSVGTSIVGVVGGRRESRFSWFGNRDDDFFFCGGCFLCPRWSLL